MSTFSGIYHSEGPRQQANGKLIEIHPNRDSCLHINGEVEASTGGKTDQPVTVIFQGILYNQAALHGRLPRQENVAALLVKLYQRQGISFLSELNGSFIVVILDREKDILHITRDHLGLCQLYYQQSPGGLIFGDTIKAVLAHREAKRVFEWRNALNLHEIPYQYETWAQSVYLLPEGGLLTYDLKQKRLSINRYWDMPTQPDDDENNRSFGDILHQYKDLLHASIQCRVSGRENLQLLVSGGLDSTLIGQMASAYAPVKGYNFLFPPLFLSGDTYKTYRFSEAIGAETEYLLFSNDFRISPEELSNYLWLTEFPEIKTEKFLWLYTFKYMTSTGAAGNNRYLSGFGADQYNGGNTHLRFSQNKVDRNSRWQDYYDHLLKSTLDRSVIPQNKELRARFPFVKATFIGRSGGAEVSSNLWLEELRRKKYASNIYAIGLEKKMANHYGLQGQFPFLDYRLVDYVARIPKKFYDRCFYNKNILREILKDEIDPAISQSDKNLYTYDAETENNFTQLFYDIYATDKGALLQEALKGIDHDHPVIDKESILARFKQMADQPSARGQIFDLMPVINCCLLERALMRDPFSDQVKAFEYMPEKLKITDWGRQQESIALKLGLQTKKEIDPSAKLRFTDPTMFLTRPGTEEYYLLKNNVLTYEIEKDQTAWIALLNRLNDQDKSSLEEMLKDLKIELSVIRDTLDLAMQEELIEQY